MRMEKSDVADLVGEQPGFQAREWRIDRGRHVRQLRPVRAQPGREHADRGVLAGHRRKGLGHPHGGPGLSGQQPGSADWPRALRWYWWSTVSGCARSTSAPTIFSPPPGRARDCCEWTRSSTRSWRARRHQHHPGEERGGAGEGPGGEPPHRAGVIGRRSFAPYRTGTAPTGHRLSRRCGPSS